MQHPYGPGLAIPPLGIRARLAWELRRKMRGVIRRALRPLDRLGLDRYRITQLIWAKDRQGLEVRNYRTLHEGGSAVIAMPEDTEFLGACKHYRDGTVPQGEVFVCEVTPARYLPALGLVANEAFEVFGDSVLLRHRFELSLAYRSFRPRSCIEIAGPVSSVQRIDAYNFWHWMADCLPQVLTLERYMEGRPLTLLVSDTLGGFQRAMLDLVLPATFHLQVVAADRWIATDRFILPSYLSGRCNGYIRPGYYEELRRRMTRGLGLEETGEPRLRIYLSRGGARRRRVANEPAVVELLERYGFIAVRPETLSLRDQVRMFQQAEVIAGPHGAALGAMVFAPPGSRVLVFYTERLVGEYFYTMARRLGLVHLALIHDAHDDEDSLDDFTVDLGRLKSILDEQLSPPQ